MVSDQRPESAPPGTGDLPGMLDLYAEYERARAEREANPTSATIEAHGAAMQALADGRQMWRQIRDWQTAVVFREWIAQQPDDVQAEWAAAEADARATADRIAALEAEIADLRGEG